MEIPILSRYYHKMWLDFPNLAGCRCKRTYQQLFKVLMPNRFFILFEEYIFCFVLRLFLIPQERGQNNFTNYASQLQVIFARSEITKILKQLAIPSTFVPISNRADRTNLTQICAPTWGSYFVHVPQQPSVLALFSSIL